MKKTYKITRTDLKKNRLKPARIKDDGKKITAKCIKHLAIVISIMNTKVE